MSLLIDEPALPASAALLKQHIPLLGVYKVAGEDMPPADSPVRVAGLCLHMSATSLPLHCELFRHAMALSTHSHCPFRILSRQSAPHTRPGKAGSASGFDSGGHLLLLYFISSPVHSA